MGAIQYKTLAMHEYLLIALIFFFIASKNCAECTLSFDNEKTHGGLRYENKENIGIIEDRNIQVVDTSKDLLCDIINVVVGSDNSKDTMHEDISEWRCIDNNNIDPLTNFTSRVIYDFRGGGAAWLNGERTINKLAGKTKIFVRNGKDYVKDNYTLKLPLDFDFFKNEMVVWYNGRIIEGELIDGELVINGNSLQWPRKRSSSNFIGNKRVLVIRAIGSEVGQEPDADASTLSRRIFGGYDDNVNLKSGYENCSAGQLTFNKATGNEIVDGVVEVNLDISTDGLSGSDLENSILNAAKNKIEVLRDVDDIYDFIMICLPQGTAVTTAYGFISGIVDLNISVYNNDYCIHPSVQMHEVGHNLGLYHSSDIGKPLFDLSDIMGLMYTTDHEFPKMCFNGVKSSLLGWYDNMNEVIDFGTCDKTWSGNLVGVADYASASGNKQIVVAEIESGDNSNRATNNYYILYNRQDGINNDVQLFANEITITRGHIKRDGKINLNDKYEIADSVHLSSLAVGETYSVEDYRGSGVALIIKFCEEVIASPSYARVVAYIDSGNDQPDQCVQAGKALKSQSNIGRYIQLFRNHQ